MTAAYPRIVRRNGARVIGGVAGGVADHLGTRVQFVRIAFVALAALAGAGVALYGLLWFFCPPGSDTDAAPKAERTQAYGLALLGAVALILQAFFAGGRPLHYLVPLVIVAVGAVLVWREVDVPQSKRRTPLLTWTRIGAGVILVIAGLAVVVIAGNRSFGGLNFTLLAVGATLVGVVLLTIPLWMRLVRTIDAERAARIRTAERDEIAAHLHDSVLQTLALIQKQAASPDAVGRLARGQERELRRWLFGDHRAAATSLAAALAQAAGEIEDAYGIEVDVVTVGDLAPAQLDGRTRQFEALVGATREALVNAAKHSGEKRVDVYSEVSAEAVDVFVRDRGHGFDPDTIAHDRHGVQRSIKDRLERHGGDATIKSTVGRGTEVAMRVPREDSTLIDTQEASE